MKLIRNFILLASVALLAVVACKKTVPDSLSLTDGTVKVTAAGMEYDLDFSTNVAWTAVSSESWLTVAPESGEAGDVKAKVTVAANTGVDPRSASVKVTAGSLTATVTFEQARPDDHEQFNTPDDYKW